MNNVRMMTLAQYMAEKNVKDGSLAEAVGCDRSMITKIRRRQATPSLSLAVKINEATGIPVKSLLLEAEAAQ